VPFKLGIFTLASGKVKIGVAFDFLQPTFGI